jgi:CTD small phosphatase-like protein 2
MLGRDLGRTVIVDNCPHVFSLQVRNGIPIESFLARTDQREDRELLGLLALLQHIAHLEDVRPFLHTQFQIETRIARRENVFN